VTLYGRLDPANAAARAVVAGFVAANAHHTVDRAVIDAAVDHYIAAFTLRPPIEQVLGTLLQVTVALDAASRRPPDALAHDALAHDAFAREALAPSLVSPLRQAVLAAVLHAYYPRARRGQHADAD
jgi:hypothetical protein